MNNIDNKMDVFLDTLIQYLDSGQANSLAGVIWYGSKDSLGDRDIIIIHHEISGVQHLSAGKLDITLLGCDYFENLLNKLDPIVTEPILTGTIVCENKQYISKANKWASSKKCDIGLVQYLVSRSIEEYFSSSSLISGINPVHSELPHLQSALVSMSFAYSYLSFAKYYKNNLDTNIIALKRLLLHYPKSKTKEVLDKVKKQKRGEYSPSLADIEKIFREFLTELCPK